MAEYERDRIEAVLAVEARWAKAHRPLDLSTIESILSDEYLRVASNGSLETKRELLASYGSGGRQWDVAESSNLDVTLIGDTAVVIGEWRGVGTNAGDPFDYRARFLAVYLQEGSDWKLCREVSVPLPD